jgi:hypothetical protein
MKNFPGFCIFSGSHKKTETSRKFLAVFVYEEADFGKFCVFKNQKRLFGTFLFFFVTLAFRGRASNFLANNSPMGF